QIGQICWQSEHAAIALQRYSEALSIFENLDAVEDVLLTLEKLCQLQSQLGHYGKALAYRQAALNYESQINRQVRSH
ncbi:MAG: hypothetical protein AAFU71_17840, partial [Cyanobacteria bacterium J06632_22]